MLSELTLEDSDYIGQSVIEFNGKSQNPINYISFLYINKSSSLRFKKKQPALRRKKTAKPSHLKTKQQEALSKAAVAVTDFAKSDLQKPPKELVDAVNRYLSVLNRGRKRKPIDTIVPHRKILVGQIVIHCIWALDEHQLEKAEKTLLDIASCFARTYRMGNEWMADMAINEQTDTAVIDKETAAAFRKGDLTMLDIIRKHHKTFSQK